MAAESARCRSRAEGKEGGGGGWRWRLPWCKPLQYMCTTLSNKRLWFALAPASSPFTLSASKLCWPSLQPRFETYFDMFGEETPENSVFKGIYHLASGEANGPLSFFSHNWFPHVISCIYMSLWSFLAMFLNPFFLSFPWHSLPPPRSSYEARFWSLVLLDALWYRRRSRDSHSWGCFLLLLYSCTCDIGVLWMPLKSLG